MRKTAIVEVGKEPLELYDSSCPTLLRGVLRYLRIASVLERIRTRGKMVAERGDGVAYAARNCG